jgi:hypothetical protein
LSRLILQSDPGRDTFQGAAEPITTPMPIAPQEHPGLLGFWASGTSHDINVDTIMMVRHLCR